MTRLISFLSGGLLALSVGSAGLARTGIQETEPNCVPLVQINNATPDEVGDGSEFIKSGGYTDRHCMLDGRVIVDEFRVRTDDGSITTRGVGIEYRHPTEGFVKGLWSMINDPGVTIIFGHREADQHHVIAYGFDNSGTFADRATTEFEEGDRVFHTVSERSYDGGETWISPFWESTFYELEGWEPAPLPSELVPSLAEIQAEFDTTGYDWQPILDGYAALAFTVNDEGEDIVHMAAHYPFPDRWRVISWNLVTGFYTKEEVSTYDPEEEWLVFASQRSGNGDILATNLVTGETVEVAATEAAEGTPRYDRARDRIIHHRFDEDSAMLVANGEDLFVDPNGDVAPVWSPNGDIMIYAAPTETGESLFLKPVGVEQLFQISGGPFTDRYPAFDPTGTKVVFARNDGEGSDLYISDIVNRTQSRLTYNNTYVGHPVWSNDGSQIAVDMMIDGQTDIAIIDVESRAVTRLTEREGNDLIPTWSGNDGLIAFGGDVDGNWEIFTVDVETREISQITDSEGADGGPVFVSAIAIGQN